MRRGKEAGFQSREGGTARYTAPPSRGEEAASYWVLVTQLVDGREGTKEAESEEENRAGLRHV